MHKGQAANPVEKLASWHEHYALTIASVNGEIIATIVNNCNQFKPLGSGDCRSKNG